MARGRHAKRSGMAASRRRRLQFETLENRALLSLTHLYTFNDGTANDAVGGAHATLHNGATLVNGQLLLQNGGVSSGQATEVQYAQLPADILPAAAVTVEAWFVTSTASSWTRVFDIGNQSGTSGDSYFFFSPRSGPGDSRAVLHPSGSSDRLATGPVTADGVPHMVAAVIDSPTGQIRLYIDGTEVGTGSLSRAGAGHVNDVLAYLGRSLYDADPGFTGTIDEVRIYDEPLSASVIAAQAAAGPIASSLAGNFDADNDVDGTDFLQWQRGWGSTTSLAADANLNGVVDGDDLPYWQSDFGQLEPGPTASLSVHDEVRTFGTLNWTEVTMTGQSELRITGAGNPLHGSIVHLNSDDAWLLLTNVAPSAVNAAFLKQVRVNGAPAVLGTNVRVVQYELGTVVIPHAADFEPLEAFSLPHFEGASKTFGQYTYYDSAGELGVVASNISSFKLKRGYMATISNQPNGSGWSQVFVAQDSDLDVAVLPEGLDNNVQYVYVVPWRWVSKKGSSDLAPETLNAAWHYNWNNSLNSPLDWEYVPIRQQRWWPGYPFNKPDSTILLGYNEPNNPVEDAYQTLGNGSVDAAIAAWPELEATGLRLGSPAVTDGGKAWLYEFMDKAIAAGRRVDFIAIHNYQANHTAGSLYNWLKDVYDRYHLPIWITEFNNGANWTGGTDPTYEQNAAAIGSFINMFDETPWIERYSIYSRVEAVREMTYADGTLTPAGQVYYDNDSPIGYRQQGVPAGYSAGGVTQLLLDGNALDSSGSGNHGQVVGTPAYVVGQQGQALELDGTTSYVQLADNVAQGDEFSFAGWVKWDGGGNWQRIFDFGNDTSSYLFLTPSNGSNLRFAIKNGGGEQIVQTSALTPGEWTHVAVTLGGGSAKLYVNGALAATNNSASIKPSDFAPKFNYLGESQFAADPLFNGQLDDIHIADYVLSPTQIAGLMTNNAPQFATSVISLGTAVRGAAFTGSLAGMATDADGRDSLSYSKLKGPAWLSVAANGALSGTPGVAEPTEQEFVVTVTDNDGASSYAVLTLELANSRLASAVSYAVAESQTASVQTAASDLTALAITVDQADPTAPDATGPSSTTASTREHAPVEGRQRSAPAAAFHSAIERWSLWSDELEIDDAVAATRQRPAPRSGGSSAGRREAVSDAALQALLDDGLDAI